jgi:hypothetical protein
LKFCSDPVLKVVGHGVGTNGKALVMSTLDIEYIPEPKVRKTRFF